MKVIQTQSAVLSNHEVLVHVQSVHERYKQYPGYASQTAQGSKYRALSTVVGDVTRYLLHEKSPLSASHPTTTTTTTTTTTSTTKTTTTERDSVPAAVEINPLYNTQTAHELLRRLEKFRLTKSELLIILNLRPKDIAALDAMVEECDERFSDQQQEEILNIVAEVLGTSKALVDAEESNDLNGSTE